MQDSKKNNIKIKTKLQKHELIYYPFNLKNFIEKINLTYIKSKFIINSKVDLLNYTINLNTCLDKMSLRSLLL